MECRLMCGGGGSNLKQFNIRQQQQIVKKMKGMNTFARHCVCVYIYIYVYMYEL